MRNQAYIIKNSSRTISSMFFKSISFSTLFFILIDKVTAVEEHSKHKMKIPLMYLSTWTPEFAPIELAFSKIKRGSLNEQELCVMK